MTPQDMAATAVRDAAGTDAAGPDAAGTNAAVRDAAGTDAAGPGVQDRMNAYWSTYAGEYDAHQRGRLGRHGERAAWERVWAEALPAPAADVLDVGCGSGHATLIIAGLGHRTTGIDLAAGMLAEARAKAEKAPVPPEFVRDDAADPAFAPGTFDAVTARYALWTLRRPDEALRRWHALLREGGVLVVVDSLWFPEGLLASPHADDADERTRHFRAAYAGALGELPLAEETDIGVFAAYIRAAGFTDVRIDELDAILDLDRRHGVAPNHAVQMNYRITATRR